MSLLLEQNEGIAHHAKLAVISVAENVPENLLESEILNGVLAGLSDLYRGTETSEGDSGNDPYGPSKDQQDDEAVIGKAVVVVVCHGVFMCHYAFYFVKPGLKLIYLFLSF